MMKKLSIVAADGYKLVALFGQPVSEINEVVVISSATGIKKEFYMNFAQYLVERGCCVLLYDYRGIGESAPSDLRQSKIFMHEWGTLDMNAVLDYLVYKKGFNKIVWLGHSIGAQLVGFLKNQQYVKKIISVNAAVGYWGYFPFPMKATVWLLWYIIGPLMIKFYGYGQMQKIGWGENLPKNAILEWREWCTSKTYYANFLKKEMGMDKFYNFKIPITAFYLSDDYIANDRTAPLMMQFFPNVESNLIKIDVRKYTNNKVGHVGIFRKRFEETLWPVLLDAILQEQ
ncbi:MAG: alpha/beta fold hydrolase [Allomuricauda sp.]